MKIRIGILLFCLGIWLGMPPGVQAEDDAVWAKIKTGEYVVLMRHALAPGVGDPASFTLGDCSTQRNLSARGRKQAWQIGNLFRSNGIGAAKVYSSQWCRCLETARLLELGPVTELPVLNSFFREFEREEEQTRALENWVAARVPEEPTLLVTHQVNITALTEVFPAEGELVVVRRSDQGTLFVVDTIETR